MLKVIRPVLTAVVLLCFLTNSLAQRDNGNPDKLAWLNRVGYGGNLGLRFGDITYVEVSPIAGYRVAPFLMPGIGLTYRYISYHYSQYGTYANNVYGGSVWLRAYVAPMIFGYAEYETINGEWDPYSFPGLRSNLSTTFVGGGYSQEINRNSTYLLVLFALSETAQSIYWNPVIRVGFMLGGNAE